MPNAVQITVLGTAYDISVQLIDSKQPLLTSQPWWRRPDLAEQAANDVGNSALLAGSPQLVYFAFGQPLLFITEAFQLSGETVTFTATDGVQNFAIATPAAVAVPEINGPVLAQVLLILSTVYLLLRRRRWVDV